MQYLEHTSTNVIDFDLKLKFNWLSCILSGHTLQVSFSQMMEYTDNITHCLVHRWVLRTLTRWSNLKSAHPEVGA